MKKTVIWDIKELPEMNVELVIKKADLTALLSRFRIVLAASLAINVIQAILLIFPNF